MTIYKWTLFEVYFNNFTLFQLYEIHIQGGHKQIFLIVYESLAAAPLNQSK